MKYKVYERNREGSEINTDGGIMKEVENRMQKR